MLASAQSGGSCIHIIDLDNPDWKQAYSQLEPLGKISDILKSTAEVRKQLQTFTTPKWERKPLSVYFMTESRKGSAGKTIATIEQNYTSPIFLNGIFLRNVENMDRSSFISAYQNRRDRRKKYTQTSEQLIATLSAKFENTTGIAYWGGHGNDPFQTSLETQKAVFDAAKGKKTVTIYPELEQHDQNFA